MVVAELPLWVVHGDSVAAGNSSSSSTSSAGGANSSSSSSTPRRREDSLSLLLSRKTKTAIYSIDCSPTSKIFATAGGDGAIRIWNSGALFPKLPREHSPAHFKEDSMAYVSSSGSSAEENGDDSSGAEAPSVPVAQAEPVHDLTSVARRKDGTAAVAVDVAKDTMTESAAQSSRGKRGNHRLLCTLTAHTGSSVLCVRFSHSGDYLASAGDDACVCVYARQSDDSTQWSRTKLCRGHGLDVVDLAWAPDDSHLVSCSLDSATPIIVWKPMTTESSSSSMICNPFKVLGENIHTSTVKGVTFDPAGSYVASSGDDPAVCIWRAHDDWGLEARIDSGIFRQWKGEDEESVTQSLFRRISWSTDGTFICTTNAVVKNKHVASTISREGWAVAAAGSASGAANLVGHRQPVVVSRHASKLLSIKVDDERGEGSHEDMDADGETDYATLLALGDRRGFVTIWSTKKTRPIFKLQCSESRCSVTDLSWGSLSNGDLMLLVALLDGQVVALQFSVPDEIGPLLSNKEKAQIFRQRYGIDTDDDFFVGQSSGPRLIENTLQLTLEEEQNEDQQEMEIDSPAATKPPAVNPAEPQSIKDQQKESRSKGKKRVQPVLMQVEQPQKRTKATPEKATPTKDPVQQALDVAERSKASNTPIEKHTGETPPQDAAPPVPPSPARNTRERLATNQTTLLSTLPHSKERVHSVDLPLPDTFVRGPLTSEEEKKFVFECSNVTKTPNGSKGNAMACIDVTVKENGRTTWKDSVPGSSCCALAASRFLAAVGTTDGSILLFGTSPSMGWMNASSFRSHPPLVIGHPIVSLQLKESKNGDETCSLKMLVVAADGFFAVYSLMPDLSIDYKGSILPAVTHMSFSAHQVTHNPTLSRAFLLDNDRVVLLLSFYETSRQDAADRQNTTAASECGPGGALQAFVYLQQMETWIRTSDSRFLLSDFYSSLPGSKSSGPLSDMDDAVRLGCLHSSLKASHRSRFGDRQANLVYNNLEEESGNFLASRSHCEDRIACAFALQSTVEFKKWLALYVKVLVAGSLDSQLRHLVDMLLPPTPGTTEGPKGGAWWIGQATTILGLDRTDLVRNLALTEIGRNRSLQRLANEIAIQLGTLT